MPPPAAAPSAEVLAAHLARLEEQAEAGQPAASDATLAGVKAEIDTIVADLRQRPQPSYEQESACRKVIEMVQAIGRDPEPERTIDPSEIKGRVVAAEPAALGSLGVYELLTKLGEGGMGAVYKARHTKLDKIVAIKVLPSGRVQDQESVARFEREMRAVGKLEHQNIVRAMDAGEADGRHFLVMEYVPGIDLSQLVKQLGPLPVADACELIRQAAVGLEEARENGMVHRDIKPSNLMLCVVGKKKPPVVKVLDMGLALLSEAYSPEAKGLTTTGQMMGTLDYMAPEQGGDSHEVDIRADIYSLGASLYKLLCGEVIYHGPQFQTPVQKMMALATQAAPPIQKRREGIPAELAAVLHRMLAKTPAKRYSTPEEVAQALAPFCGAANLASLLNKVGFDVAPSKDGSLSVSAESRSQPDIDTDRVGNSPTLAPAVRTKVPLAPPRAASPSVAPSPAPIIQVQPVKPQPAKPQEAAVGKSPPWLPLAIGGGLFGGGALLGLIALAVFYFDTPEGTLRVEINDPTIEVTVKGTNIVLKKADKEEIVLTPGPHALVVKRGDFIFTTRDFELKKDEVTTVRVQMLPGKVQVAAANGRVIDSKAFGKAEPGLPVPGQAAPAGPALPAPPISPPSVAGGLDLPAGKFALSFDLDDEVIVPKVPHRPTTVVTIEAWLSVAGYEYENTALIVGLPNGKLSLNSKAIDFSTHHGDAQSVDPLTPGPRVHLAGVNDGQARRLYLNGKLIAKSDDAGIANPNGSDGLLSIGDRHFRGAIDAIRVSTKARYVKEFTPPTEFKADKETFALYEFKEGQGDVLNDTSRNGYHAKIKRAKWVRGGSPAGDLAGLRVQIPEGSKRLYAAEVPSLPMPEGPVTLEGYVKIDAEDCGGNPHAFAWLYQFGVACPGGWAKHGRWLQPAGGELKQSQVLAKTVMQPGSWHHLAAIRDAAGVHSLYLDGVLQEKSEPSPAIVKANPDLEDAGKLLLGWHCDKMTLREVRVSKVARYSGEKFTPAQRFEPDADTLALFHCDDRQGSVLKDASGNNHHGKIVRAK